MNYEKKMNTYINRFGIKIYICPKCKEATTIYYGAVKCHACDIKDKLK